MASIPDLPGGIAEALDRTQETMVVTAAAACLARDAHGGMLRLGALGSAERLGAGCVRLGEAEVLLRRLQRNLLEAQALVGDVGG